MSHFNCDADIERIGLGLVECWLPKPQWTHAAHFAAAFWVLRHPVLCAQRDMPGLIRRYNESTGVANTDTTGYHETITLASLRAARDWLAHRSGVALHVALNDLMRSQFGRPDWLLLYWSRTTLFGVTARRTWVPPDQQPLPF